MPHILAALLALLQLLSPITAPDSIPGRLHSGEWLRLHVIPQDDSEEMQQLKYVVRDAVQRCYQASRLPQVSSMQQEAERLLPRLQQAALQAAREAGFSGEITIILDDLLFDQRELHGTSIPAGRYPALIVRLGDAQGHNWWGLLDPELSLRLAGAEQPEDGEPLWDWSWQALLAALFGTPLSQGG